MRCSPVRKLLAIEWDTLSGIAAAMVAMVLSFFDLVSPTAARAILLLIVALILLREMRRDSRETQYAEHLDIMRQDVRAVLAKAGGADITLIPPAALLHEFQDFAAHLHGAVTWYNACCGMFRRPEAFRSTLGQLIDNPDIEAIHMLCDHRERSVWESDVSEQVRQQGMAKKVRVPLWGELSSSVSFLIGARRGDDHLQALVAVMEEPLASRGRFLRVPRYLFRIQNSSPLLAEMKEMIRTVTTEFEQVAKHPDRHDGTGRLRNDGAPADATDNGAAAASRDAGGPHPDALRGRTVV